MHRMSTLQESKRRPGGLVWPCGSPFDARNVSEISQVRHEVWHLLAFGLSKSRVPVGTLKGDGEQNAADVGSKHRMSSVPCVQCAATVALGVDR